MIKAEVISHEGSPGPNWLDRCRSVATPANVTIVALLIIGSALFIGITRKEQANTANKLPATSNSQQAPRSESNSLQVQPLSKMTTTEDGSASVQSAAGGSTAAPAANTSPAQNNTSAPISAPQTPALNNSNRSRRAPQTPLTNTLQSTVQNVQSSVNRTLNGLTSGLGL